MNFIVAVGNANHFHAFIFIEYYSFKRFISIEIIFSQIIICLF